MIGYAGRQLIQDSAAITGHRRGPRLRPVVRSTMDRPGLMMLVVLMLVGYAVRLHSEMQIDYADRQLIEDSAAITGHRRGPRLRPVVRSAMYRPVLARLIVNLIGRSRWSHEVQEDQAATPGRRSGPRSRPVDRSATRRRVLMVRLVVKLDRGDVRLVAMLDVHIRGCSRTSWSRSCLLVSRGVVTLIVYVVRLHVTQTVRQHVSCVSSFLTAHQHIIGHSVP